MKQHRSAYEKSRNLLFNVIFCGSSVGEAADKDSVQFP